MAPGMVVLVAATLAGAGWRWHGQWRVRAGVPAGRPTSSRLTVALAAAAGILLAAPVAAHLSTATTWVMTATGLAGVAWVVVAGTAVLAAAVLVGAAEVGYRGLWRSSGLCPRLVHGPIAVALPAVLVAVWPLVAQAAPLAAGVAPATAAQAAVVACTPGAAVGGFSGRQLEVAAVIVAAGRKMGVPQRGQETAVAAAMQESSLRVLANPAVPGSMAVPHDGVGTDHDSVGPFQQRPSWGPTLVLMDPAGSARLFYAQLVALPGWQAMPLTEAAQAVQRSAYPDRYARWEDEAAAVVAAVTCTEKTWS